MRTLLCLLVGVFVLGVMPLWAAPAPVVPEAPAVLMYGGVGSVAIRPLADMAGATVKEDGTKASITYGKHVLELTIDSKIATQDGVKVTLPAAPFVAAGITYAPLRTVVTALSGTIIALPNSKTLRVNLTGVAPFNITPQVGVGKPEDIQRRAADLFLIAADGSAMRQLTYDIIEPTLMNRRSAHFLPGGTAIAYSKGMDIVRRSLSDPSVTNLTVNSSAAKIVSGSAVPLADGSLVFMQLNLQADPTTPPSPDLGWISADGAGYKKLAKGVMPQVSADGKFIAYMDISKGEIPFIHVMKADGSADKELVQGMLSAVKPDGTEILYSKIKKDDASGLQLDNIAVLTVADGKEVVNPEKDSKSITGPLGAYSADGKRVVLMQQVQMAKTDAPPTDDQGIWIMDANLANKKQLTKDNDRSPQFSPDGSNIAFVRQSQLYIMKADGSDVKLLTPGAYIFDFAFSPDGTQLLADGIAQPTFPMKPKMPTTPPPAAVKKSTSTHKAPTTAEIAAAKAKGTRQAIIKTAKGLITLELYGKDAPQTVASFVKLVQAKFYDGLIFHRVEPGFVIQGGDPEGTGMGGPGYTIKLEIAPKLKHIEGALAMARTQEPDSAGSQFYITMAATPMLDGQYAVFGKVLKGMDVVKKIAKDDKIISITVQ